MNANFWEKLHLHERPQKVVPDPAFGRPLAPLRSSFAAWWQFRTQWEPELTWQKHKMPRNTTNSKSLLFKISTSTNPRKPVFSQIMFTRLNSEDVGKIRREQVCQLCNELMRPGNAGIGTNQKDPRGTWMQRGQLVISPTVYKYQ